MKHLLALALLLSACGAAAENEPEFLIDSDGSEIADLPWSPVQTNPPVPGELQEAFQSTVYYGTTPGTKAIPCYAEAGNCIFPQFKDAQLLVPDYASCDAQGSGFRSFIDLVRGQMATTWNGVGGVSVALSSTCSGNHECVSFRCAALGGAYAVTTDAGGHHNVENDLPGTAGSAENYSARLITIDAVKINNDCVFSGLVGINKYIGSHEGGHALGFGHFLDTGLDNPMRPQAFCSSTAGQPGTGFFAALSAYNGSGGSITILSNSGLAAKAPCISTDSRCP